MQPSLDTLLIRAIALLEARCKPVAEHRRAIILLAYLTRGRIAHQAISALVKANLHSECAALLKDQIEMRCRSMLLCSDFGSFATDLLHWHEELRHRLIYLHLEHLESASADPQAILCHPKNDDDRKLLHEWYTKKPLPPSPDQQWVFNWQLWSFELLVQKIREHLVESPRVRKEIDGLLSAVRDHNPSCLLDGMKRYVMADEEVNGLTRIDSGEERWTQSPLALSAACLIDMAQEIAADFELGLDDDFEAFRHQLNRDQF